MKIKTFNPLSSKRSAYIAMAASVVAYVAAAALSLCVIRWFQTPEQYQIQASVMMLVPLIWIATSFHHLVLKHHNFDVTAGLFWGIVVTLYFALGFYFSILPSALAIIGMVGGYLGSLTVIKVGMFLKKRYLS